MTPKSKTPKSKTPKSKGTPVIRVLFVTLALLVLAFVLLVRFAYQTPAYGSQQSLNQVYQAATQNRMLWVKLLDENAEVIGQSCAVAPTPATAAPTVVDPSTLGTSRADQTFKSRCPQGLTSFNASYPRSDVATQSLIDRVGASGAQVVVDKQTPKAVAKILITFMLPLLVLANLFALIFLSNKANGAMAEIASFGAMGKRQKKRENEKGITFADVAGADEAVIELREVTDYLTDPQKFEAFGAAVPKGVLLFGPPGCGKTLLARATAGETGVAFFSVSGTEFVESLVGVGAARVRDLFRQVRAAAPAIMFIDEIDAVGRRRSGEGSSGGEREQTLNQLLVEMDGFEPTAGIVLMGATNRPDILDPALMRPGRFDRHVTLVPPDVHGRKAILGLHAAGKPMADDVDLDLLARRTPGFTGADLANVINEGALLTIRAGDGTGKIRAAHLSEAVQRVMHGPQRKGQILTAEERKRIAHHESGHALAAAALGRRSSVHRISILARGKALGQSALSSDDGERVLLTHSEMSDQLTIAMAGIAAEQLYFGEASTTAESDIDRVTELALQMVGRYGMSTQIGWRRVLTKHDGYLGDDGVRIEAVSGQTLHDFDQEVKRIIDGAAEKASELLTAHRRVLEELVERLEEDETLEGPTLTSLLAPATPEMNLFADASVSPVPAKARQRRGL